MLIELSEACYYPQNLLLHDLMVLPYLEASGGFGDVYKGLLREQPVAVKVLRIYQQSDVGKTLKVSFFFT